MTQTHNPIVFVLLPVHNRREITRKFVACLAAQTYPHVQLVVIDDGSTDGTAELVMQAVPSAAIVKGDGSWWWGGSMQQGYRWLLRRSPDNDDLVLLANDDIEFEQDFLERAVDCLRRVPHALLAARLRHPQTGAALETGVYADMRRFTFRAAEAAQEINCLPTRALLVRWADMRRLGEFHPRLLPHYWADYEYTMRARSLGMQCITTADVLISANPQTTGFHDLDNLVGWKFLRQLFSIKTPLNPVYRTSFVLLASPWSWKAVNVANVWVRAGFRILWQGVLHRRFPRQALPTASA